MSALAESARAGGVITDTRVAMAEASHDTAPALQGKGLANPLAMILAAAHFCATPPNTTAPRPTAQPAPIYESALEMIATGIKTPDLGGHAGATEFT